jgi:hypothetical protein
MSGVRDFEKSLTAAYVRHFKSWLRKTTREEIR